MSLGFCSSEQRFLERKYTSRTYCLLKEYKENEISSDQCTRRDRYWRGRLMLGELNVVAHLNIYYRISDKNSNRLGFVFGKKL